MGGQGRERAFKRKKEFIFSPKNCWTMTYHMECTSIHIFLCSFWALLLESSISLFNALYVHGKECACSQSGWIALPAPLPACCSIATCFSGIRGLWQSWNFPFCPVNAERLIVKRSIFSSKPWKPCRGSAFRKLFFPHKENPSLWTDN